MKLLYVSWLMLFVCELGRCDLDRTSTNQVFATGGAEGGASDDAPDLFRQRYWVGLLGKYKGAYPKSQQKNYFIDYKGRKDKDVPKASKPESIIGKELSALDPKGPQMCAYRCMQKDEAGALGVDLKGYKSVSKIKMENVQGHIGHLDQAWNYCQKPPPKGKEEPVLVEFLLKPNAHNLLFSPKVAAIGKVAHSTAMIAEKAEQEKQGKYVVKEKALDGYVEDFIGIKSEDKYFSITMQANKAKTKDNATKRLFSDLTQYVTAYKPKVKPTCSITAKL